MISFLKEKVDFNTFVWVCMIGFCASLITGLIMGL